MKWYYFPIQSAQNNNEGIPALDLAGKRPNEARPGIAWARRRPRPPRCAHTRGCWRARSGGLAVVEMEAEAPPPLRTGVPKPRRSETDRGKGGHRPKPRMDIGLHKNQWVKTCVDARSSLCTATCAADTAACSCALCSYYICPVPECKWSGSSRSRHAKSRRACSAVPIAFRYQPGADVGKMVRVALESTAVLTCASQEAEAAAATEASQVQNPPAAPPAYPPAGVEPFAESAARPAAVGAVAQPAIASAAPIPPDSVMGALEDAEDRNSHKRARTDGATATPSAATVPTHALMHAPAVPTGVPETHAPLVPMGVPEALLEASAMPTGVQSPTEPPSLPIDLQRAPVEPPRALGEPSRAAVAPAQVTHTSVTPTHVVPQPQPLAVAPSSVAS